MPEIIQRLDLQDRRIDRSRRKTETRKNSADVIVLCPAKRGSRALIYRATPAENADLMSVSVYSAVGLLNMSSVSPSSTIFPFLMTMT